MTDAGHDTFEEAWARVAHPVKAFCAHLARNDEIAECAYASTVSRAWRGFSAFRGEASFQTYAMSIAKREVLRAIRSESLRRARGTGDVSLAGERASDAAPDAATRGGGLAHWGNAIGPAMRLGYLTAAQAGMLGARIHRPSASWEEIGRPMGIDASTAAVHHFRGIQDLRMYGMVNEPDLMGGLGAMREGMERALGDLSAHERHLLEQAVFRIDRRPLPMPRLSRILRNACAKVARRIPPLNRG